MSHGPDLAELSERLRVAPDSQVDLAQVSTRETFGFDKDEAPGELAATKADLDLLQQRLYAEGRRSVLLVLQAMDAAGKDGTIRHILAGLNPQGIHVSSFGVPGGPEAEHDYLWRVHQQCPSRGAIGVFNRSHYEDVLVVRVRSLAPEDVIERRYRHIREFERMLVDEGTSIVKVFLHVSKDEQRRRLQERLDDPEKLWKFRRGDLDDRALWDDYQHAFELAIARTSTDHAPWHVVPADRNWLRNLVVAKLLLHALQQIDPQLPPVEPGLDSVTVV